MKNSYYLKVLHLNRNLIENISDSNICFRIQKLEEIDLSYNKINYIDKNAFKFCKQLKALNLDSNQLDTKTLNQSALFQYTTSLEELNLNQNNLDNFFNEKCFFPLKNLKKLTLLNNRIENFDEYNLRRKLPYLEIY